jgi:hypothetical protein
VYLIENNARKGLALGYLKISFDRNVYKFLQSLGGRLIIISNDVCYMYMYIHSDDYLPSCRNKELVFSSNFYACKT